MRRGHSPSWPSAISVVVQETLQPLGTRRVAELAQGLRLDLPDALARDVELLADLFQRVVGVHFDAETHAQYFRLARGERIQYVLGDFAEARIHRGVVRRER